MENRQFKSIAFTNIKAKSSGNIRVGICAVMGNVDSYGDRIHLGAFAKTIKENFKAVKFLWNHDYSQPPIASIKEFRELTRDELPPEVLEKAPEATGGLLVAREYYEGNSLSEWILKAIDSGDVNEMSFAYDVVKYEYTEEDTGLDDMPKRHIRELKELKLYDASDVNWGANGATVAVGAKNLTMIPLGAIVAHLQFHQTQSKAGSRNSAADAALIENIHSIAVDLGAKCEQKTEAEKSAEPKPSSEKAEAVEDTSLTPNWLEMQKRAVEMLDF